MCPEERENPAVISIRIPGEGEPGPRDTVIVTAEESPIALTVRDALLAQLELGGANLEVRTDREHVVLSGSLNTEDQRELALRTAGRIVGRDSVEDNMSTQSEASFFCEA